MIVRINQFDVNGAEAEADWAPSGLMGPLSYLWPPDSRAYEVFILEQDEQGQPLDGTFRQAQMRQLIPQALAALRESGEEVVLRFDGPVSSDELLPIFNHLSDERFAVSEFHKLEPGPGEVIGSVRLQANPTRWAQLCADLELGLERSVRLRAFSVPPELANPLLNIGATDDERWGEILSRAGFSLSTARGLRALHIVSRRLDAGAVKSRLMARLTAAAQTALREQRY